MKTDAIEADAKLGALQPVELSITLNGKQTQIPAQQSLQELFKHYGITEKNSVATVNDQLVTRAQYGTVQIPANAVVELVRFVGGG